MRKFVQSLLLCCLLSTSSLSAFCFQDSYIYDDQYEESFDYVRVGGFSFLYCPLGAEFAYGHRHRIGGIGYGPLVNISISAVMMPAISFKYEGLLYLNNWRGAYVGIMPGIGIANSTGSLYQSQHEWILLPTFEFVIGKEIRTCSRKREFYYVSITPYMTVSFNYGWGF